MGGVFGVALFADGVALEDPNHETGEGHTMGVPWALSKRHRPPSWTKTWV
jgi:hypothetical protein